MNRTYNPKSVKRPREKRTYNPAKKEIVEEKGYKAKPEKAVKLDKKKK